MKQSLEKIQKEREWLTVPIFFPSRICMLRCSLQILVLLLSPIFSHYFDANMLPTLLSKCKIQVRTYLLSVDHLTYFAVLLNWLITYNVMKNTSIWKQCCVSSRNTTVALNVLSLRSRANSDARTLYVPLDPLKARRETPSIILLLPSAGLPRMKINL